MAEGRCSMVLMLLLPLLVLHPKMVHASTFMVGDLFGWTYNVGNWPIGKTFRAEDVLVFRYWPMMHNVVVVDEAGYNTCNPARGTRVFSSGMDYIQIPLGLSYFICGFPGHCQSGMKIAVNAVPCA